MAMETAQLNVDSGSDKRRHKRIEVKVSVKYKVINRRLVQELVNPKQTFADGESVNISLSGLSLDTKAALTKGDYLKMEINLPHAQRETRALAEVMWVRPESSTGGFKAGIRFLIILNEADEHSIKRFVQSHGG
jgi:c-di-GMP-binding flagellar brake protein YcgR